MCLCSVFVLVLNMFAFSQREALGLLGFCVSSELYACDKFLTLCQNIETAGFVNSSFFLSLENNILAQNSLAKT